MEHELIRRRRMGIGAVMPGTTGQWTAQQLDQLWTVGVNSVDRNTADGMYASAMSALAQGYQFSQPAKVNIAHWAAYTGVASPEQLDTYNGSKGASLGGVVGKLSSLPFVGPLISKFTGGGPPVTPSPVAPVAKPQGFLDMVLSPVGLLVGAVGIGAVAYAATRKPGRKPGRR